MAAMVVERDRMPAAASLPRAAAAGTSLPAQQSPEARPRHPGAVLEEQFLRPRRITQQALARELEISRRRVNELIRGHRGITADTALRLGRYFGNEPEFWMRLQVAWDLHRARALIPG